MLDIGKFKASRVGISQKERYLTSSKLVMPKAKFKANIKTTSNINIKTFCKNDFLKGFVKIISLNLSNKFSKVEIIQ